MKAVDGIHQPAKESDPMPTTILATYSKGVFHPESPVNLPEHTKVALTVNAVSSAGSPEAIEAFIRHCRETPLRTGVKWNGRDELYDRV